MATQRQKKVAKLVAENAALDIPKTAGEIVESSGYGVSMKKNPQVILESQGVKDELAVLGFSVQNAKSVVQSIMIDPTVEPNARLKATDQVFKVQGAYAPEKSVSLNINADAANPKAQELAEKYEEELKRNL